MKKKKTYSLWQNIKRLVRMKLIVPLLRSPHPPEYKARGVAVGLAWAMTPLVGIQMWLVFMTWGIAKKLFRWNFSLALGIAWTWVTNIFTMVPCYYIFYVTGQILRGRSSSISGYDSLANSIRETFMGEMDFWDKWILFFKLLLKDWGVSMAIGCLPWMVLISVCGYYITIRFEEKRQARRQQSQLRNKKK